MTRFELVDVCKARRGWAHASVATQTLPAADTSRYYYYAYIRSTRVQVVRVIYFPIW